MADFPSSLPKPKMGAFSEGAIDPWVEDAPEVGSNRRRARFTRDLATFDFTLRLTDAQLATLKTFYRTTLSFGVDAFTWTHPITAATYSVRMSGRFGAENVTLGVTDVSISLVEV